MKKKVLIIIAGILVQCFTAQGRMVCGNGFCFADPAATCSLYNHCNDYRREQNAAIARDAARAAEIARNERAREEKQREEAKRQTELAIQEARESFRAALDDRNLSECISSLETLYSHTNQQKANFRTAASNCMTEFIKKNLYFDVSVSTVINNCNGMRDILNSSDFDNTIEIKGCTKGITVNEFCNYIGRYEKVPNVRACSYTVRHSNIADNAQQEQNTTE